MVEFVVQLIVEHIPPCWLYLFSLLHSDASIWSALGQVTEIIGSLKYPASNLHHTVRISSAWATDATHGCQYGIQWPGKTRNPPATWQKSTAVQQSSTYSFDSAGLYRCARVLRERASVCYGPYGRCARNREPGTVRALCFLLFLLAGFQPTTEQRCLSVCYVWCMLRWQDRLLGYSLQRLHLGR